MDREPWPSTYDRDLDVPIRGATGPTEAIEPYRRLLVNPLLAVACAVGAVLLLRASLGWRSLTAFVTAIVLLGGSTVMIQLHCLDCGRTIWLLSSRRHACGPALERWRGRRGGRWRFPSVRMQVTLWSYLLASAGVLLAILLASGR